MRLPRGLLKIKWKWWVSDQCLDDSKKEPPGFCEGMGKVTFGYCKVSQVGTQARGKMSGFNCKPSNITL